MGKLRDGSLSRTTMMTTTDDPISLAIPCIDEERARAFAEHLTTSGVDVTRVDGRTVYIPTKRPPFAWDLAEIAVQAGFCDDHTVATSVAQQLIKAGF